MVDISFSSFQLVFRVWLKVGFYGLKIGDFEYWWSYRSFDWQICFDWRDILFFINTFWLEYLYLLGVNATSSNSIRWVVFYFLLNFHTSSYNRLSYSFRFANHLQVYPYFAWSKLHSFCICFHVQHISFLTYFLVY